MTYDDHLRQAHRASALRPARADEHPPLPINPAPLPARTPSDLDGAPGRVIRVETRYHGNVPVLRRIDSSGRVLWDGVTEVIGWEPGLALDVTLGAGHWVTFRSAGRARHPSERRLAHLDRAGRLVIPAGVRTYMATDTGEVVVLRPGPGGSLQVAGASILALALDVLDRVEAATPTRSAQARMACD